MAGISFDEFVNGGSTKKGKSSSKGISVSEFLNTDYNKKKKPAIDFSQYDPDILNSLKQDSSTWNYDLFDAEDMQRKAQGLMPKSLADDYDLDDPIDKALYEGGYVSRKNFSKGYQQAERDNASKADFNAKVIEGVQAKLTSDPEKTEKQAFDEVFEELRKSDSYKGIVKTDDKDAFFKQYAKGSMQSKLADAPNEFEVSISDWLNRKDGALGSVGMPQPSETYTERRLKGTTPVINTRITPITEEQIAEAVQKKETAQKEEKAEILTDAAKYQGDDRIKDIDSRIKEISRTLNRTQGVQQTYITPDKVNALLDERNALQAELSALQGDRAEITAGRNASALAPFYKTTKAADFEQNSSYDPARARMEDVLYSFINGETPAETSMINPVGTNAPASTSDPNYAFKYLTDEEKSIYNYLVNTGGDDKAFLEAVRPYVNKRMREAVEFEARTYAEDKPVLSSLQSIVTSPITGIEGLIGLGKTGINTIKGQDTDPNDPVFQNTRKSNTIRNTVANTIKAENQGFVGEALAMLYQTGMSMGDTAIRLPMGAAGLGIAGLSASASAMDDALSRGATSGQALTSGLMTGAAEVVFEKASLDNLLSMSRAGNIQQAVKNILKQGGIETSEEVFTEIANTISDAVIMADKSKYETAVRENIAAIRNSENVGFELNGVSPEEAEKLRRTDYEVEMEARQKASMEIFKEIINAGFGGFISGGAFGTGGQMMALGQTALTGRAIENQGLTESVISEGMAFPAGNEARTQAEQTLQKPNALNVGRQFYANQDANAQLARDTFQKEVTEATGSADHADIAMKLYDRMVRGKAPQQIVKEFSKIQDSIRATAAKKAEINAELENEELKIKTKLETSYGKMVSAMEAGDVNAFNTARQAYINEYKISASAARLARMKTENRIAEETAKVQKTIENAEFTFEKLEEIPQWEATRNAENATAYADMMQALEAGNQEEFRRLEEIYNNTRNATEIADRTLAQNADVIYDQIMTAMEENDPELRDRAQNLYERAEKASKAGKGKGEKVKAEAVTNATAEQKPKTEKKAQPPKRTNDAKIRDAGKQALRKLEPSAKEELFKKFGKNADAVAAEMLQRYYAEVDGRVADDIPDNVKEKFFEAFENAETGFIETDEGEVLYQSEAIEDNAPEEKPGPGLKREYNYAELTEAEREIIRNSDRELSILDSVAKAGGVEIALVRTIKGLNIAGHTMQSEPNGIYDRANGKIYIALDAQGGAISYIAFHELTHYIKQHAKKSYGVLEKTVFDALGDAKVRQLVSEQVRQYGYSTDVAREEVLANAIPAILTDEQYVKQLIKRDPNLAGQIKKIIDAILDALTTQFVDLTAINPDFAPAADLEQSIETLRKMQKFFDAGLAEAAGNHKPQSPLQESRESRRYDAKYMQKAIEYNEAHGSPVPAEVMQDAANKRAEIAKFMNENEKALALPADIEGNTAVGNSSYGYSQENSTVCIRSLMADEFINAISERLGRPLTEEEAIFASQEAARFTDNPQCIYCYVAMDRNAFRAFLGKYLEQRDETIAKMGTGATDDQLYKEFLGKRKPTNEMRKRFDLWMNAVRNMTELITPADLASDAAMQRAIERNPKLEEQINDAKKYAQSASWAKKRIPYRAYNNGILSWKDNRVRQLNRMFGMRMYSFSDFSPAFILENMQMFTDAAVQKLKVLAYTKDVNFVKIFAPTNANINLSVYGYFQNGQVGEDAMQGAPWEESKRMREQYPNVGITFVATNDKLVEWALDQDWIDVVIPFHLVRTGKTVADMLGFMDYTKESGDKKTPLWRKGKDAKEVYPTVHQNDKAKYFAALKENNLSPRFERWVNHPNYMKLVNETRRASNASPAVQPIFNTEAAYDALDELIKRGGYEQHVGGSVEEMRDIASETAEKIKSGGVEAFKRNVRASARTTRDAEYMTAVESGDMATAQRMVDAYAVENGFDVDEYGDPDMLFHGTDSFGFTTISTSASDDQLTFWATPNMGVAGSYYKDSNYKIREIGKDKITPKAEKLNPYTSAEKIVAAAKPVSNELGIDLSKVKPKKEAAVMKKAEKHIQQAVASAKVVANGNFSPEIKRIAERIISTAERGTYEDWHRTLNDSSWEAFSDITGVHFDTLDIPDGFNINKSDIGKITDVHPDVFKMMYHIGDVYDAVYADLSEWISSDLVYEDVRNSFNEWASEKGIYAFYHKQSNPFIYDCQFSKWNQIKVPDEARGDIPGETTNTRTLAKWAFENGYDSIKLDNVHDSGGWSVKDASKHATVWAFKNPQNQLKSADPVTYDDNGRVIPISERFNTENNDIRYSDRAEQPGQISQAAKIRAEAERLYNEGVTIQQYYAQNKDNYSVRVGRMLMALWLKNGTDVGGKIADNKMNVIMQNRDHFDFKGILGTGVGKNIKLNLMSPLRVFEDLASWRKGKDSESRAMNYLEGEAFKEMFFDPVLQAGAQANMFMEREAEKVKAKLEAIPKQDRQMASCLVQLVGEGLVTENEASFARFGKAGMLVRAKTGNYVFNKDGQLAAIESTDEETGATTLAIFDDSFYRRIREANKDIEKILGNRNALMSNTEKNRKIQEIKQRARQNRPIILDGQRLIINEGKDRINVQTTSGREILNLQDVKSPEIKKVTALVDVLRDFYDRVHAEQSRVLVEAGYNPVPKQKAYFPHQGRESAGIMDAISTIVMGEADKIPTEIIGKTGQFKPGKPFVNHLLARLGDKTEYDAIRGFNRYLRSAADLMYYTPAIQRLRQLENFLRAESQGTQNNAIVAWLQEYTNSIANKKHSLDRGGEALVGREAYTVTDKLTGLFGAASVSGNLSTALSNNISLLTAVPGLEKKYIAKAAKDSWNNAWREVMRGGQGDDFAKKIPFLARRFGGYEALLTNEIKMAGRKVNNAMGAMFAFADQFAVETAARAKYAELMAKGDLEAVRKTNEFLLKNFADRSKGMMPTIYNMRLLRLLTQFQLEGQNQLSHFGDMSRATIGRQLEKQLTPEQIRTLMNGQLAEIDWSKVKIKSHDPREIASKLLYLALLSLWGLFTRWTMGRDQTWNPAGMTVDFVKALGEEDVEGAFSKLGQDVLDQVPFIQTLTGGGRIPAFGGIQNVADAVTAIFDKDSTGDLAKITQGAAAFVPGGAQISKTIRGIDAYARGGSYSGKGNLRYPVEQNAGNLVRSVLFGPASNQPRGYDYLTDTLTEKKTGAYKELVEGGMNPTEAYNGLRAYGGDSHAAKLTSLAEADVDERTRKLIAKAMGLTLGEGSIKSQAKAEAKEYLAGKEKQYKSGKITKADLEAADKKTQDLIKRLMGIK